MWFQQSKCLHLLGFRPRPPSTAPFGIIRNGKKQMKTYSKCCVSSISVRSTCHMPSASAGLRPYLIHKGYARNLSEMTENFCEMAGIWCLKRQYALPPDHQWISNGTNQKWNEINENVREILCYVCVTSSASGPRFCPHPIPIGFASEHIRSGKKLTTFEVLKVWGVGPTASLLLWGWTLLSQVLVGSI